MPVGLILKGVRVVQLILIADWQSSAYTRPVSAGTIAAVVFGLVEHAVGVVYQAGGELLSLRQHGGIAGADGDPVGDGRLVMDDA